MTARRAHPPTPTATRAAPDAREAPSIRPLARGAIDALLAKNHVGRLAYSFHDRVDIEPIHYVYNDGVLCLRTSAGSKLIAVTHNPWVALEVDEVRDMFDWESVVVRGTLYRVVDGDDPASHATYERTLACLRTLVPKALRDDDPAPFRSVLYRLHVAEATGRSARPSRA